jgi:hypothetical protein
MKTTLSNQEKSIIEMMRSGKDIANYFWTHAQDIKWFSELKMFNFFNTSSMPILIENSDGLSIGTWMPLYYLEKMIKNYCNFDEEEQYEVQTFIIDFIDKLYKDEKHNIKVTEFVISVLIQFLIAIPTKSVGKETLRKLFKMIETNKVHARGDHDLIVYLLSHFIKTKDNSLVEDTLKFIVNRLSNSNSFYLQELSEVLLSQCEGMDSLLFNDIINVLSDYLQKQNLKISCLDFYESLFDLKNKAIYNQSYLVQLVFLLNELNLKLFEYSEDSFISIAYKYLESTSCILNKLGLYLVVQLDDDIAHKIFFEELESDEFLNHAFYNSYCNDELGHLLKKIKNLNEDEEDKLLVAIDRKAEKLSDGEKYLWKQKRLSIFINNKKIKERYDELKQITQKDVTLSPMVKFTAEFIPNQSPISSEELLKLKNDDIAIYLKTFREKSFFDKGPSIWGLSREFRESIKNKPDKFIEGLDSFLGIPFIYLVDIFDSFCDLTNEDVFNRQNVKKILAFISSLLEDDSFWNDKYYCSDSECETTSRNVCFSIALFLEKIISNKYDELVDCIVNIIKTIHEHPDVETKKLENINDIQIGIYNTLVGRKTMILIRLGFLYPSVKPIIEKICDEDLQRQPQLGFMILGYFIAAFYRINANWTMKHVNWLIDKGTELRFFMEGYFNTVQVYRDIASKLSFVYRNAIETKFQDNTKKKVSQHFALLYLYDYLEDSQAVFLSYIKHEEDERILDIIHYFESEIFPEEKHDKIFSFWKLLHDDNISVQSKDLFHATILSTYSDRALEPNEFKWLKKDLMRGNINERLRYLQKILDYFIDICIKTNNDNIIKPCAILIKSCLSGADYFYISSHSKEFWKERIKILYEHGNDEVVKLLKDIKDCFVKSNVEIFNEIKLDYKE